MSGINGYDMALSTDDIERKAHREAVGGMWDEIGRLQFDFLVSRGLAPGDKLADIGCGALRGGLHFIEYLDAGHYCGLDINASLIQAAAVEVEHAGLAARQPRLLLDDAFRLDRFNEFFDVLLSVSVFTHLPMNHIIRCLVQARGSMGPDSAYYATYFEAPGPVHLDPLEHQPGGVVTGFDHDPFHYGFEVIEWMAGQAGLRAERIGDWGHPRNQMMALFRPAA